MIAYSEPGLHIGVYSYPEAARLLGVSAPRVARWANGYTFPRKYDHGESKSVPQTSRHAGVLSFNELWELMFVKEYVAFGVPLPLIRETAEALASEVGDFPFSTSDVLISGRELLVKTAEGVLKRAEIGQLVADYAAAMAQHVEIRHKHVGGYDIPEFDKLVYLDKELRGGETVISERAIPTRIVYNLWDKEKQVESVAEYFELSAELVSVAIRYEGPWRLAA